MGVGWIKEKLSWLFSKWLENGRDFVDVGVPKGGMFLELINAISLLAIIIGCFFIIAGNRKIGTKITSATFVIYIIIKACGA